MRALGADPRSGIVANVLDAVVLSLERKIQALRADRQRMTDRID